MKNVEQFKKETSQAKIKMIPGLVLITALSMGAYFLMTYIEPFFAKSPKIFSYIEWVTAFPESISYKLLWIIGDFTEAMAYKSVPASIFLILGCLVAHYLCKTKPKLKIYPISVGSGNLPWILLAATIGLLVSTFTYGSFLEEDILWIPTFLPGCTIPAAIVILFGGGWKTSLSAGVLSGFIQFPFALFSVILAQKFSLPPLVFITIFGICIAGVIIIEIFRILPWNRKLVSGEQLPKISPYENKAFPIPEPKFTWMIRRTVTDLTELSFFGSEIAGVFLLVGALLSWALNPGHICSGIPNLFPAILTAQILSGGLCAFLFYDKWVKFGFFPSFSAVIGASVCVMQLGTSLPIVIIITLLNVFITAPLSGFGFAWTIQKIKRYPALCGTVIFMGIGIAISSILAKLILTATGVI